MFGKYDNCYVVHIRTKSYAVEEFPVSTVTNEVGKMWDLVFDCINQNWATIIKDVTEIRICFINAGPYAGNY